MHHFSISFAKFSSSPLLDLILSHLLLRGEEHVNGGMTDGNGMEAVNKSNRTHHTIMHHKGEAGAASQ
jgi:hypothetical protein